MADGGIGAQQVELAGQFHHLGARRRHAQGDRGVVVALAADDQQLGTGIGSVVPHQPRRQDGKTLGRPTLAQPRHTGRHDDDRAAVFTHVVQKGLDPGFTRFRDAQLGPRLPGQLQLFTQLRQGAG